MGTVYTLRWEAPAAGTTWVEVAEGDGFDLRQAVPDGTEEHVLVGLKPDHSYRLRVRVGDALSDEVEVQTVGSPPRIPGMQAETLDDAASPRPLLSGLGSGDPSALIVDGDGSLLWWYAAEDWQTMGRVWPTVDGSGLWMAPINIDVEENCPLRRMSWTGELLEERQLPWGHHDFLEHDDGTIAYLAYAPGQLLGFDVEGAQVVEQRPDGSEVVVFDAAEALADVMLPELIDERWPHANALDYLPEEDAYLVSFMTMDSVIRVDRATGAVDWMVGGSLSTLVDDSGQADFFDAQHQFQRTDDGLLAFVNGTSGLSESRLVEVAMDPDGGFAEETWRYEPGLESPVFGDVDRDEDGHTRVVFSFAGEVHELSAEGELLWRLQADLGGGLTYGTWLEPFFEE